MNVYDFDGTIYRNDSPTDFYFFLLHKNKKILRYFPNFLIDTVKYQLKFIDKTKMKETFYQYLNCFKEGEIDKFVSEFWDKYEYKIYDWYKKCHKDTDIIISASPSYLLLPICKKLGIKYLICSDVNKLNGNYTGLNCYGSEKLKRFYEEFPDKKDDIDEFYSDSESDKPLAMISKKAFKVLKGGKIIPWKIYDT